MKKLVFAVALLAACFTGCKKESPIYWENIEVAKDEAGITASLNYPYRFGGVDSITEKINTKIEEFLKTGLNEECGQCSLDSALTMLAREKAKDSVLLRIPYDFKAQGSVYRYGDIASVRLAKMYYTGGANYNIEVTYLNFDSKTGNTVSLTDIFSDIPALTDAARKAFFAKHKFTPEYYRDSVRLQDMPAELPLAHTVGLDSTGVVVFYNLYEAGPRSFGTTELTIPYAEADKWIKIKKEKKK